MSRPSSVSDARAAGAGSREALVLFFGFNAEGQRAQRPQRIFFRNSCLERSKRLVMEPHPELSHHLNELSYRIIGAAIEVHRHLGPGFFEKTYEEALVIELRLRGMRVQQQLAIPVMYKETLVHTCCLDLIVDDELVVEVKAVEQIKPVHRSQVLSYLRAGGLQLGLVINFNVHSLRDGVQRVIDSSP